MFTGHCLLNSHKNRIGLSVSPVCDQCHLDAETPVHFLAECPRFADVRAVYFGEAISHPESIKMIPIVVIMAYIKATKRLRVRHIRIRGICNRPQASAVPEGCLTVSALAPQKLTN